MTLAGAESQGDSTSESTDALPTRLRLCAGTVLDSRYKVTRSIGGGGMGDVYEAEHLRLGQRVAIKLLRAEHATSTARRRRFEREAQAVARIQNQNVVRVFDFGSAPDGEPFFVMEYLDGRDLRALLRHEGALTTPRAIRLILDVCAGMRAAHGVGLIHRDLKPENLFVERSVDGLESCKILDFGLVKVLDRGGGELNTKVGVPLGTLSYMSPEQARGEADVDARSDVYSLCAILYEMLSGERPHRADSQHALLYQVIHQEPRRLTDVSPFVPEQLANVIHRGLAKRRDRRPASVELLAGELQSFAGGSTRRVDSLPMSTQPADERTDAAPAAGTKKSSLAPTAKFGIAASVATAAILQLATVANRGRDPEPAPAAATSAWVAPTPHDNERHSGQGMLAESAGRATEPTREAQQTSLPTSGARSASSVALRQRLSSPALAPTIMTTDAPTTGPAPTQAEKVRSGAFDRKNPYE